MAWIKIMSLRKDGIKNFGLFLFFWILAYKTIQVRFFGYHLIILKDYYLLFFV